MRSLRYMAFGSLPDTVYEVPGVHRSRKGNVTIIPWHAYATVNKLIPPRAFKQTKTPSMDTPLTYATDAVAEHPFASEYCRVHASSVQREDLKRAAAIRGGIVDWPCVSGDAEIVVNRGGASKRMSLRDLVHKFNGGLSGAGKAPPRGWDLTIPTRVRVMDANGDMVLGTVEAALSKGVRDVYWVEAASGRRIKTTADHVFILPGGLERPLSDLRVGDEVLLVQERVQERTASPRAEPESIVSVWKAGREEVFDLVLRGPEHNFAANDFVVHNCGGGKTALGLLFATAYPGQRAIIVAPSTTVSQWHGEADKWLDTSKIRVGYITTGAPQIKRRKNYTYLLDEQSIAKLRKRGAPEVLRLKTAWREDELSEDELHLVRKVAASRALEERFEVVDDLGKVLSVHSTEEEAVRAVGVWTPGDYDVLVVGWGLLPNPKVTEALLRWEPKVLVIDEIHRGRGQGSRWSAVMERDEETGEMVQGFRRKVSAAGHIGLLSEAADAVLGLTATPQADRPRDWWAVLDLYDPRGWGTYRSFTERYCEGYQSPDRGWRAEGLSNVEELKERIACVRFHRTKAETHKGLPPLRRRFTILDLRDAGHVDFTALGDELHAGDAGGSITAMEIAVACEQKIPWAIDRITQMLREGLKVFVFVLLRASANRLVSELLAAQVNGKGDKRIPAEAAILHGDGTVSLDDRKLLVQQLAQAPAGGVLVGTLGAFGESIDGLQRIDHALFLTVPWTPLMLQQAEGRFDRLGGHSVLVEYVRLAGTIDDRIWTIVGEKLDMVADVRDDGDARKLGDDLQGISPEAEAEALRSMADLLEAWERLRGPASEEQIREELGLGGEEPDWRDLDR